MGANQYWPCRGGECVEGGESIFNAENAEAQEAQSGNTFDINLTSVAPMGIDVKLISFLGVSGADGMAGDIGMYFEFSLLPSNVSFAGLRVSEEPSSHGMHSGCFSDILWSGKWYHTKENGAGGDGQGRTWPLP